MRIFLLGFMGTGKSYWGKRWGDANHVDFFDLDKEIEQKAGMTIADIFENKSEEYFRELESDILRSMTLHQHCFVACGGGAPCFSDNMQWMNANGHTIFLAAQPQYLLHNIEKEKGKRPLLKNLNEAEMLFFIEQKLKERMPYYSQANITVEASGLSEKSFEEIVQQLTTHHA